MKIPNTGQKPNKYYYKYNLINFLPTIAVQQVIQA